VVSLPEDEAQHLTRVLRLKAGASVRVFNGRGSEFDGVVERAGKDAVRVRVGHARDAVIRDAVMMGVAAVQPVVTMRSEVTLLSLRRGHRRERWERIAVSSAKQCGRAVVPAILEPQAFETVTASLAAMTLPGPALMFVEPAVSADAVSLSDLDGTPPRETTVLIGPEGGWTAEEVEAGIAVSRLVRIGVRTLRAEVMPLVALAALLTRWREL